VRHALYSPNFGPFADVRLLAELAAEAQEAGWDGWFVYDLVYLDDRPMVDPWIAMAAIALAAPTLTTGPMVTPVGRRRPAKLAREILTLDAISPGRFVMGVGLGIRSEFETFGDRLGGSIRLDRLTQATELLRRLVHDAGVAYDGSQFQVTEPVTLNPRPDGRRIPFWGAGDNSTPAAWQRAAELDGLFPVFADWAPDHNMPVELLREIVGQVAALRGGLDGYDIAHTGRSEGGAAGAAAVEPFAEAGVTWWLELLYPDLGDMADFRRRIAAGPPVA
jgi:alkanesulfonate monooxygenase SsuD/methylene tetrahydromethanopterin reductase-like flavin-dependent oxidoreductase (luciferase family)